LNTDAVGYSVSRVPSNASKPRSYPYAGETLMFAEKARVRYPAAESCSARVRSDVESAQSATVTSASLGYIPVNREACAPPVQWLVEYAASNHVPGSHSNASSNASARTVSRTTTAMLVTVHSSEERGRIRHAGPPSRL
jgi:hypothetical protein